MRITSDQQFPTTTHFDFDTDSLAISACDHPSHVMMVGNDGEWSVTMTKEQMIIIASAMLKLAGVP